MTLPAAYAWLARVDAPRTISKALPLVGIREVSGPVNAPEIMGWAHELGLEKQYIADAVPWCGLFAAVVVHRAGWTPVVDPLWARNWSHFGAPSAVAGLGDVLVFQRPEGGHVGFYVGEDRDAFHVLGGNQGDAVGFCRVAKARLLAARRPIWRRDQPASVKPYQLAIVGALSHNEA